MKLQAVIDFTDSEIAKLEKQLFVYDQIVAQRAEMDRRILKELRNSRVKMDALKTKIDGVNRLKAEGKEVSAEEEVTKEDLLRCLPSVFR